MEDQRSRYNKVKKLIKELQPKYNKISIGTLRKHIIINIGSTEKCIQECLTLMIDTDLITEVVHCTYQIN